MIITEPEDACPLLQHAASSTSRSATTRASAARSTASPAHQLLSDPMFVAMPVDHPLARKRNLRLADLADDPWIARRHATASATG